MKEKYKAVVYLEVNLDTQNAREAREFIESAIHSELVLRGVDMELEDFTILILDNEDDPT